MAGEGEIALDGFRDGGTSPSKPSLVDTRRRGRDATLGDTRLLNALP